MEPEERIAAVQTLPQSVDDNRYWVFATKQGVIKRTALSEYTTWRGGGIIAINLDADDELIGVAQTDGQGDVLLGTRHGQIIRFAQKAVRSMGRSARGVHGIRLRSSDDMVVSLAVVSDQAELLLLTENGYGKRTNASQFRITGRGGHCTFKFGVVVYIAFGLAFLYQV